MSAVFIHSGFIDLFCNVFIQMAHGGYINLLAGNFKFCLIYFGCGIFSNMLGVIRRQNVIVSGSAPSILGILMAWAIWILYRW